MFSLELGDGYRVHLEVPDDVVHWRLGRQAHRENGPAFEYVRGNKFWLLNDKYHREDGPACEWYNGTKDGIKFWYLDGKRVTEEEVMKCSS